jgi:hypothetical protein
VRLRSVRIANVLVAALLAASCHGHATTGCGTRSCPFAGPYLNASSTLGGKRVTFVPVTRVDLHRTYDVVTTIQLMGASSTGSYRIGESDGNEPRGPLIASGTSLHDGEVLHLRWHPRLTGTRSLTLQVEIGRGVEVVSVATFQVYGGTVLRVVADCSHAVSKPTSFLIACGDGALRLTDMRYDSWSRVAAYGHGVAIANDVTPNRALGHDHSYPVAFRFSHVREFADGPRFTTLRVTYLASSPRGVPVDTFPV